MAIFSGLCFRKNSTRILKWSIKQCKPFCFAVNLSIKQVDFELLIRSRRIMRCNCIRYADKKQRDYLIDYADRMLEELDIKI